MVQIHPPQPNHLYFFSNLQTKKRNLRTPALLAKVEATNLNNFLVLEKSKLQRNRLMSWFCGDEKGSKGERGQLGFTLLTIVAELMNRVLFAIPPSIRKKANSQRNRPGLWISRGIIQKYECSIRLPTTTSSRTTGFSGR